MSPKNKETGPDMYPGRKIFTSCVNETARFTSLTIEEIYLISVVQ